MDQFLFRREMDVGTKAADMIWNANLRRMSDGFFAGLIIKLLALYAASSTPSQMAQVWDSCERAVKSMNETAQTEN